MRSLLISAAAIVMLVTAVSGQGGAPAAPRVQVTFEADGTVTLSANGATLHEILAEWARVGGTAFVGAERLPAAPLTLRYDRRPDAEVVASLLRQAAGFVIGPRREGAASIASSIGVVVVVPSSTPSASRYVVQPPSPNEIEASGEGLLPVESAGDPSGARPAGIPAPADPPTIFPDPPVPPAQPSLPSVLAGRGRGGGGGGGV